MRAVEVAVVVAVERVGEPTGRQRGRFGHGRESTVGVVEIVLIRHGQPEWTKDGLNVVDPPLTELGHEQAARMADALAGEDFDEVLVSPLQRARQTAAPLYERLGRSETIEPWLEEIRDPSWHGTPREKAEHAYDELRARPADQRWDGLVGGESIRDFTDRIHAGATRFLRRRGIVQRRARPPDLERR